MIDDFEDVAARLEISPEQLEKLFDAANIDSPHTELSIALAKLSHWFSRKIVPGLHSEVERRKNLIILERKFERLAIRHSNMFGYPPVLPEQIHISGKIELTLDAIRLSVPLDETHSAIRAMYSEIFFAPPPVPLKSNDQEWMNNVLNAIQSRHPYKDEYGVEYVDSRKFQRC